MPFDTLPPGWRLLRLADAMSAIIDYRGKSPRKTSAGVPLITAKVIKNGRLLEPEEFIDESEYDAWMRRGRVEEGDVVITTEAPLGEVAQLENARIALAQRVILLRGRPDVLDNTYLRFALQSSYVREQIMGRASGTTVQGIRQSELRLVELPLPPLSEQRAISSILRSLDDKIALNRRMNHTLEATAAALFRSWFVDFDPVVAKAEGRRALGVSADVHDIFPAEFTADRDSAVPAGWFVQAVSEFIELNPTRRLLHGTEAPYLDMAATPTTGHAPDKWILRAAGSGARFVNGDTLLARITPCLENGKSAFVDFLADGEVGWGSTEFIVLRPIEPIPPVFAYLLARLAEFRDHAERSMTGSSGRQRVALDALATFRFVRPPDGVARAFGEIVNPLFERVAANMAENRTLAALRDALLPQLLSGAIRLRNAERAVGAAV